MPAGILPETLRKTIFVLGIMMMALAGAMEQMEGRDQVDASQCVMNIDVETGNHG